jgi:hypothetical protein
MKIDYAIVSSDSNPMYLEFWPIVKKIWAELIGIKPILVLMSDRDHIIDQGDCIIHEVRKIEGVCTGLQSKIVRMYITKHYQDDVSITSDIDMLPLGVEYFNTITENINENSIAILSSDAPSAQRRSFSQIPGAVARYPICYNVAKGDTFNEVLDLECSFEEYWNKTAKFNWGGGTDEVYFGKCIKEFNSDRVTLMNRGWEPSGPAKRRIDRKNWGYDPVLVKEDKYIDSHLLRPYYENKQEIDKLINTRLTHLSQ